MNDIIIEGGFPLMGNVQLSGAKNSAIKLIYASLLTNDKVVLENVPKIESIEEELRIIRYLGGTADWIASNKVAINNSSVNKFDLSQSGSLLRTQYLATGPLLFRFGKVILPKIMPYNRFAETWKSLGFTVEEDEQLIYVKMGEMKNSGVTFKFISHTGTDNAILSSVFISGETIISNTSEESEIEDLIEFLNLTGAQIEKLESRKIKVTGKNIFKGGSFWVQNDKTEAVTFAAGAAITGGDVIIEGVQRNSVMAFVNFMTKMGIRFEFNNEELKVWNTNKIFNSSDITTNPSPGFISDWQPLAVLMLTQAEGQSKVHETMYTKRFDYVKDLNRMGAKIDITRPTEKGLIPVISEDFYNYESEGEPETLALINGPTELKGTKMGFQDYKYGGVLVLACLMAQGRSTLSGWENIERGFENFFEKLHNLGAHMQAS